MTANPNAGSKIRKTQVSSITSESMTISPRASKTRLKIGQELGCSPVRPGGHICYLK